MEGGGWGREVRVSASGPGCLALLLLLLLLLAVVLLAVVLMVVGLENLPSV